MFLFNTQYNATIYLFVVCEILISESKRTEKKTKEKKKRTECRMRLSNQGTKPYFDCDNRLSAVAFHKNKN